MNRLKWWFILVGAFYTLLGISNVYGLVEPKFIGSTLPFAADASAVRAFVDGWSAFALELVAIGTFALWASRDAARSVSVVWLIVWLQVFHGIIGDLYLIARGYDATQYGAFIAIHVVMIVTGVLLARQAPGQATSRTTAAVSAHPAA